jgi:hypothetical protein
MVTFHELVDLFRSVGIDLNDLSVLLAKKAGAKGAEKLAGASKAVILNFLKRIRSWHEHSQLESILKGSSDAVEREVAIRTSLERWIKERQHDASETTKLLFRIVYLRALHAHCNNLPVVANLGFVPQTLSDVWVRQDFRIGTTAGRLEANKLESRGQPPQSLEQAIAAGGPRIVVEGPAGSGKSTQLRKFVLGRIAELFGLDDFDRFIDEPIPVYIDASDLLEAQNDLATSLEAAVRSSLGLRLPFPVPPGFFDRRQPGAAGRLLLVVDGINEMEVSKRDHLVSVFSQIDSEIARDVTVILSSWPLERSSGEFWRGFFRLEISELDKIQANSLVEKLLGKKAAKRFLDQQSRVPRSPMLLTLAALLQSEQTISSRAALYREFILASLRKRSEVGLLPDNPANLLRMLVSFAAATKNPDADAIADVAYGLNLIGSNILGVARRQAIESLLVATGVIVKRSGRLEFIHYSFRSYLRAEGLAELHNPGIREVWNRLSPFREDWDTVAFVCEIWIREQRDISTALEGLLAFGEPGLRTISALAARLSNLPQGIIRAVVAKWMYREDEFWDPGYIDGPVQQLTLIASNYDEGRIALRQIAKDNEVYSEDSVYAAQGLADIGLDVEAAGLLVHQCLDVDSYCMDRVLAAEVLLKIGFVAEAVDCLNALASEWRDEPPDMVFAEVLLGKNLYQAGRTRAGLSLLKRLSADVTEELDLEFLSEAYADLGYLKPAAKLARKAFQVWSSNTKREFQSYAVDLVDLLDRLGLKREAAFVRKDIARAEDADAEELQRTALNPRARPDRRLASAKELLSRGSDQLALRSLESIVGEPRIPFYERFSAISSMLGIQGGREQAISLLDRIVEDEAAAERVDAICELAKHGRLDIAASGFRKLCSSDEVTVTGLSRLAETFAHTSFWRGFLELCQRLQDNSRIASVQIRAMEILKRSLQAEDYRDQDNFLRKLVLDQHLLVDDRMNAARALSEYRYGLEIDLLMDIATSPDETMEAGLAAMDALYQLGDHFAALDGGHDVVWDKKLSEDQFIEAAHHFLRVDSRLDDEEELGSGMREAIVEALVDIASNATKPFERRLAAARINLAELNKPWASPFWPGIHALIDDEATPLAVRWIAIMFAVKYDPSLLEKFRQSLVDGPLSELQIAEIFNAAKDPHAAARHYHNALRDARYLGARVHILSRLAALSEIAFSGQMAANFLDDCLHAKEDIEIDDVAIAKGLRLAGQSLPKDEHLNLARNLAKSTRVATHTIRPVLEAIGDMAGESEVQQILNERLSRCAPNVTGDFSAFFEALHLEFLRAEFGAKNEAATSLAALSRVRQLGKVQRAHACSWLANIGRAKSAKNCLLDVSTECKTPEEMLSVGEIAFKMRNWGLARRQFRAVAQNKSAKLPSRIEAAGGLGKSGLREVGRDVLAGLDLGNEDGISSSIGALLSCGLETEAVDLCRSYSTRSDMDFLDRVEAVCCLGNLYRKDVARSILLQAMEKETGDLVGRSRAGEILNGFGYQSDARTVLFALWEDVLQSSNLDPDDGLWVVEAMMSCNLHHSAKSVLDRINKKKLTAESLDRYEEAAEALDQPLLAD